MTFDGINFAGERDKTHTTLADLINEINSWDLQVQDINTNHLTINEDFTVSNGDTRNITKSGLINLCKLLRIPDPFAKRIPVELLRHNLNELLQSHGSTLIRLHWDGNNNELLNISRPIANVPLDALGDRLEHTLQGYHSLKSDIRGIQIIGKSDLMRDIEPVVGDITQGGIGVNYSPTGFFNTEANLTLFRLACSNGAVVPFSLAHIKMKLKETSNIESAVRTFTAKFSSLMSTFTEKVVPVYQVATSKQISELQAVTVSNAFTKITRDEDSAYEVLNTNKEDFTEVKARVRKIKKLMSAPLSSPEEVRDFPISFYELHNNITQKAHPYGYRDRLKLQKLGGEVLFASVMED